MEKLFFSLAIAFTVSSQNFAQEVSCTNGVCKIQDHKTSVVSQEKPRQSFVIEITTENFDVLIKNSSKPVIIDFYATWCPPCKNIKPVFEELAQEESQWAFGSIDIDKNPSLMTQCNVQCMPTFVIFKNGIQWGSISGALPKEQLKVAFQNIINLDKPQEAPQAQIDGTMELLMAINQKDIAAIKQYIAQGKELNKSIATPLGNLSPLSAAILVGTEEIIDLLLNAGAIMNESIQEEVKNNIKFSEKFMEIFQSNLAYVNNRIAQLPSTIKQTNNTPNDPEIGQQLFMLAIQNAEELKKLIAQGANVNTLISIGKDQTTTPLGLVIALDNKEILDILIDAGASLTVEITNQNGLKQSLGDYFKESIPQCKQKIAETTTRLSYALQNKK